MRKPFGYEVVWWTEFRQGALRTFGPYATLERAAYAVLQLEHSEGYKGGVFTVVEVTA